VTAPGAGCEPEPLDVLGCADAVSGKAAAALPKKVMNSRLFIVASLFHYLPGLASISLSGEEFSLSVEKTSLTAHPVTDGGEST
jgi:hypothetical protein